MRSYQGATEELFAPLADEELVVLAGMLRRLGASASASASAVGARPTMR